MTRPDSLTARHPRTMAEAFGRDGDNTLHPMPDSPSAHPAEKLILGAAILAALALAAEFGGWI